MTIGINTGTVYFTPDKTLSRQSGKNVHKISFGDGYEQRAVNGINGRNETYNLSFKNRSKADIDDLAVFLDEKNGLTNFILTIPDTNNTTRTGERDITVVCDDYTVNYTYDDFYSLTAKLRRVYEA